MAYGVCLWDVNGSLTETFKPTSAHRNIKEKGRVHQQKGLQQ
jgi:hypothetical protein